MTHQALADRTVVISGGSRGIGLAFGIAAAKQGANVVLLAKTDTPHPRLPGNGAHRGRRRRGSGLARDLYRHSGGEQPSPDLFLD